MKKDGLKEGTILDSWGCLVGFFRDFLVWG